MGKTTLVKLFAREFDVFIELNLEEKENARLFAGEVSFDDLLAGIYAKAGVRMENKRTLIFIDEIQNEPEAVRSLRYFYEKRPDLHVIAAGSLLESLVGNHISFPVGRVEYMALHPCTFTEFLGALGENVLVEQIERLTVPQSVHSYVMDLFRKYMIVGGLPEAVANYAKYKDWVRLNDIFNSLIAGYKDDIEKYAKELQKLGAKNVLISLGGDGAMLIDEFGKRHKAGVLKEKVINTVGSGDSMVAGFVAGYEKTKSYPYALKLGSVCGNATAFLDGLATKEKINELLAKFN